VGIEGAETIKLGGSAEFILLAKIAQLIKKNKPKDMFKNA
jgi:hypothetical protein